MMKLTKYERLLYQATNNTKYGGEKREKKEQYKTLQKNIEKYKIKERKAIKEIVKIIDWNVSIVNEVIFSASVIIRSMQKSRQAKASPRTEHKSPLWCRGVEKEIEIPWVEHSILDEASNGIKP